MHLFSGKYFIRGANLIHSFPHFSLIWDGLPARSLSVFHGGTDGGKKKNLSMMVTKPTAQKCKWTLSSVCSKVALQQWKGLIHIKCSQQYQRRVEFSQSKSQRTEKKAIQTANWGCLQRRVNAQMCSRNIFLQPANRFRTDNYFLRNSKKLFSLNISFVIGPNGHP